MVARLFQKMYSRFKMQKHSRLQKLFNQDCIQDVEPFKIAKTFIRDAEPFKITSIEMQKTFKMQTHAFKIENLFKIIQDAELIQDCQSGLWYKVGVITSI